MDPAHFYTGIVADAYAGLKGSSFDPARYRVFVVANGQPGLEIGCGDGQPLLDLRADGLDVEGVDSSADMLERCRANALSRGIEVRLEGPVGTPDSLPSGPAAVRLTAGRWTGGRAAGAATGTNDRWPIPC